MFEDLGDEERVQRWLVVPDFCVELVAFEAKRGLGEFKALVRANLYSGTEGNRKLEDNESRQQGCQDDERLVTGAVRDGHLHFLTTPDFMRAPIIRQCGNVRLRRIYSRNSFGAHRPGSAFHCARLGSGLRSAFPSLQSMTEPYALRNYSFGERRHRCQKRHLSIFANATRLAQLVLTG